MEEQAKSDTDKWDSALESLDLLFAKVEEIERNQHKVEMKVKSTEKIVTAFEPDKPYCSVA
jgi:exosome complex RNA-binding protein Rrp4